MRPNRYKPRDDAKCHCGAPSDLHLPGVNPFEPGLDFCAPCAYGIHTQCECSEESQNGNV